MKPLTNVKAFLQRFDNFKNAEFRSITIHSATVISIEIAVQDTARGFDWISLTLEFSGVTDAKLLENTKLSLVDMSDGISIINTEHSLAFALGECYNHSNIKNSSCFINATSIKYQEGLF